MKTELVYGRFVNEDGDPIQGAVEFIPSKIWVEEEDGTAYPTLAPIVELVNGRVMTHLTRTDDSPVSWHYTMICPAGRFPIYIETEGPLKLRDLIPQT